MDTGHCWRGLCERGTAHRLHRFDGRLLRLSPGQPGLGDEAFSPADTVTMCMACHGADGLGANTNVADGVYDSHRDDAAANGDVGAANTPDGAGLLGGGFVTYRGKPVTSAHPLTGLATAPRGNGAARGQSGTLLAAPLTCISCHDPHGSGNYRNLRHTVNGQPVTVAQVDEGAAKDYDTEQWGAGTDSLCAACHSAYNATSAGSGSDGAMVASGDYTHRVGMPYNFGDNQNPETIGFQGYKLPLAQSGNGDLVACMTCHLPHGSPAEMSSGDGSNLLRIDNSGVCQVCHQL
ncbi:MAG: hypothetical protein ACE5G8_10335 [Anaerolineae bacterium]